MASTAVKIGIMGAAGVGAYLLYRTYSAKNQSPYPSGLAPWADQTALGYPAPYTGAGGSNPTPAGSPPIVSIPMSSIDPSGNTALKIYSMVPPGVPVSFSTQQIYSNSQAAINGKVEIAPGITVSPLDIWSNTDVSEGQPIEGAVRSGDWCSCASIPLLDPTPAMLPGGTAAGQIVDYLGRPMSTATVAQTLANGGFCTTPGETMKDAQSDTRFMAWYNVLAKVPGGLTLFQNAMQANQQAQSGAQTQTSSSTQQGTYPTTAAQTVQAHSAVVDTSATATGSSKLSQMLKVAGINLNSYGVQDTSIDGAVDASGGNVKAAIESALKGSSDPYIRDHAGAFATTFARGLANANLNNANVSVSIINPGSKDADVTLHATAPSDKLTSVLNEINGVAQAKNAVIFSGSNSANSAVTLTQLPNGSNVNLITNNVWAKANVTQSLEISKLQVVAQNPVASLVNTGSVPGLNVNNAWANANIVQTSPTFLASLQPVAQNAMAQLSTLSASIGNNAWAKANIVQPVPIQVTRPSSTIRPTTPVSSGGVAAQAAPVYTSSPGYSGFNASW